MAGNTGQALDACPVCPPPPTNGYPVIEKTVLNIPMHRLFYVSTATQPFNESTLAALVEEAAGANLRDGVTGALAYNGVNFAQVLEGNEPVLDSLMARIRADPRHSGVIIVRTGPAKRRRYDGWSMKRVDGLDFKELLDAAMQD